MPKPTGMDAQDRQGDRTVKAAGRWSVLGLGLAGALVVGLVALVRDGLRRWGRLLRGDWRGGLGR